jgi:hypothetical protein
MKQFIPALAIAATLMACNSNKGYKKAEDALDAGNEFVRASLDGDYDKAAFYLYKDTSGVNQMLLNKWKGDYEKWRNDDKIGHKKANIIVITTDKVNDSTLSYVYSNSYINDTTTIKIIRVNGEWLVDLKDIH